MSVDFVLFTRRHAAPSLALPQLRGPSVWRLAGLLLLCLGGSLQAAHAATPFGFNDVAELAAQNAKTTWKAPANPPEALAQLSYDAYRDIRFDRSQALWHGTNSPYEVDFFHLGPHGDPVRAHEVTPQGVRDLPYQASQFNFGKNTFNPAQLGNLPYGGVRAFSHLNAADYKDELIAFLGASYFRALGRGQRYGLSARGLALDTIASTPEEFPRFTRFWLQTATPEAPQLTLFALLDSPRATGAYRFDVTPGTSTVVQVQARVYLRATDLPTPKVGWAPLTSMFFFGDNQPSATDFRPEVHDSDGLMVATNAGSGNGEWLWRPLQNPSRPLASSWPIQNLAGFGLMQRHRAFSHYEDTEARYELRPSAWITPQGQWGPGRIELLQLPTPDETHDNVVAYWVPDQTPAPGEPMDFAYQIAWQGDEQQRPPSSWVTQTRRGYGYGHADISAKKTDPYVQFVIDFAGPALDALPDNAAVQAVASTDSNGRVVQSLAYRNPATGAWRVTLRVQAIDPTRPVDARLFLQHQEHTLSETWTYVIHP